MGWTNGVMVQRLREGWLKEELAKVEQLRDPPVPVVAWLAVDGENHEGLLYGWATNPNGADDGWRGLVRGVRKFARGFEAEFLSWVRAEHIRQRTDQDVNLASTPGDDQTSRSPCS